jgi:GT2 family glycosyltransferase
VSVPVEAGAGQRAETGVVIATRDRRDSLLRSVAAIEALPERPPIVVVDNASSDGTAEAVTANFPAVELLALERNRGIGARNLGLERLHTRFVAFSDDDSWWSPGALARAAATFSRHPAVGLLAARILVGSERRLDQVSALMEGPAPPGLPGPRVSGFLACGVVVRREAFLAAGGFCERFLIGAEETLLAIDMRAAGWELCYAPDVVAVHAPHPASRGGRSSLLLRNELWTSWLRRPAGRALRDTAGLLRAASHDDTARRALLSAVAGLPWALRARRAPTTRPRRFRLDARPNPGARPSGG